MSAFQKQYNHQAVKKDLEICKAITIKTLTRDTQQKIIGRRRAKRRYYT